VEYLSQPPASNLCGQTCVAMLAGVTINDVASFLGTEGCTNWWHLIKTLRNFGIECADRMVRYRPSQELPTVCIVRIHFADVKNLSHYIVFYNDRWHDPDGGITQKLSSHIRVTSYLEIINYNCSGSFGRRWANTSRVQRAQSRFRCGQ